MTDIFGKISIDTDAPEQKSSESPTPAKQPLKRKKPTAKKSFRPITPWLILPIGVLTIYTLLGFWGVPYYITHFIPEQLQLKYNLKLTAETISFNPYTFNLTLDNSSVTQQNDAPLLDVEHIDLTLSPIELLRMEFVCQEVLLSSPHLHLLRNNDNSYNISPLLPGTGKDIDNRQMMTFSDLPILFSLNNITVVDGSVLFVDEPADKIHKIEHLELQLPTLSNIGYQADKYIRPRFSAVINGSPVTFKDSGSDHNPETKTSQTEMTWELQGVKLEDYINYLPFDHPFESTAGNVDGAITLQFNNQEQHSNFLVAFKLGITNFACNTANKTLQLNSDDIAISGSYNPVKKLATINNISVNKPQFSSKTASLHETLGYFSEVKSNTSLVPLPSSRQTSFIIQSLNFTDGYLKQFPLDMADPTYEWINLNAKIENFVSDEQLKISDKNHSSFNLTGQQKDKTHKFSYNGVFVNPTEVTGGFSIDKLPATKLISAFLTNDSKTTVTGITHLEGKLSSSWDSKTRKLNHRITDIKSSTKKITITDDNKTILKAEELQLSDATIDTANMLGSVRIDKGQLYLYRSADNSFFTHLLTSHEVISSLIFNGDLIVAAPSKTSFALNKVQLSYKSKNATDNPRRNLTLSGTSMGGGTVKGDGLVKFKPLTVDLTLKFNKIRSKETESLLTQPNFITKSNGVLSGSGTLSLPQNNFVGSLNINNGRITHHNPSIRWDNCIFEDFSFTSSPYHRTIGRIDLQKPKFETTIQKNGQAIPTHLINFYRELLKGNPPGSTQPSKVNITGTDIQEITLTDGQMDITDTRLSPPWIGAFSKITGHIKDIHSAKSADNSSIFLSGVIDGSSFNWKANIAPNKSGHANTMQLSVEDYPLTKFSALISNQTEIDTKSATVRVEMTSNQKANITEYEIDAKISGLKPLKPTSEAALPIALMSDIDGVIHLQSSIKPTQDSTNLSLFETLMNNFQTKILKGSLSPLLLTQGDFTDLIDNEYITFQPGLFMLTEQGRKTLTRYGALLVSHPNIKLSVSEGIDLEADRVSLHNQLEKDENLRVEKENEKLFAKWQKKKREFESQVSTKQNNALSQGEIFENDIPSKVLSGFRPLLPEPVIVDNEMLNDLAERRLDIVRKHILTQLSLDESRIEIVPYTLHTEASSIKHSKGVHIDILPTQ